MTVIRARWYPASVRTPDGTIWRKAHVVAAEGGERRGLHIFRRPSERADWWGDIDWSVTTSVPTDRRARSGVSITLTTGGVAVVTYSPGCRCGALGRWAGPSWATTTTARAL